MTKKTKSTLRIDWIKMPVNLLDDERICELIDTKGIQGFGVYMALVIEMFRCQKHCLTLTQVKNRKYNGATKKTINQIINDYDLFTVDAHSHVNSNIDFLSVLETRHLQSGQIKNASELQSDAHSDAHADLNPIAIGLQSDVLPSPARVIIRDRDIDKEHHLDGDDVSHPDFISQMRMDTSWAAMVMLKSGFASLIRRNWDLALEEFRNHAIVNCSIDNIRSVDDARKYFHFYVTNSFSGGLLKSALEEHERLQQQNTEYRYEDRNSRTGNRLYHGIAIPDDAPPRPDERAEWNHEQGKWE